MNCLRRALDRLCTGAGKVFWRVFEWPGRADSWRGVGGRWAWIAFCCFAAFRMWQHAVGARVVIVAAVAIAAWRTGGAAPAAEAEPEGVEEQSAAPREEQLAYVLGVIRSLIGDRNGTHLTDVRTALEERGSIPAGHRIADIRLSLERLGIPVRDQLKIDRANRPGVHRDDLAALGGGEAPTTPPRLVLIKDPGSSAA